MSEEAVTSLAQIPARAAWMAAAIVAVACGLAQPVSGQAALEQAAGPGQPILVELFTSEGCSDCPPADALLARLDADQFIPGAHAIVLSEHVTYWNHLGWRDPFSLDSVTERQQQYAQQFRLDSTYTPQMVVDGSVQFVGSDARRLIGAVTQAAATPKLKLSIENPHWENGALDFSVRGEGGPETTLMVALAENATHSEVKHGENAGRTLHHVAVVQVLKDFGSKAADGRPLQLSGRDVSATEKTTGPLRLVAFLANRKSGHVVAVTEQTLNR